jgi:hypothetical protein
MTRKTLIGAACAGLMVAGFTTPAQAQYLSVQYSSYPSYSYYPYYGHSYSYSPYRSRYYTSRYSYYPTSRYSYYPRHYRYWDYDHYYPRRSGTIGINPRWYPGYGYVYW